MAAISHVSSDQYFAAVPTSRIGEELMAKRDAYNQYLRSSNLCTLWRTAYRTYYGLNTSNTYTYNQFDVGTIISSGSQGEIARIAVNHARNLGQHILVLASSQRPEMQCRSINTDSKSLAQAYLGTGLLEYYMREKRMERDPKAALESAICMGEGYWKLGWNVNRGKAYGQSPEGLPVFDGDVDSISLTPFDVIKDVSRTRSSSDDWKMTRTQRNRFDVAAPFRNNPKLHEQIMSAPSVSDTYNEEYLFPPRAITDQGFNGLDTSDVNYYEFFHPISECLPEGRYTVLLTADCVLYDGPLPYASVPVYRVSASDIIGTPFGWTPMFDMLGIQMVINKLYTAVTSNQFATAVSNFWQPPGNQPTVTQLGGGLNLIESVVKPELLNLTGTPAEVFAFINKLESILETLSGINSVARGNPESSLKSGSALALVASQAIQFNSGLEQSYAQILEDGGLGIIEILQRYATTPRVAFISGSFNRPIMKDFRSEDLLGINRVFVDVASALSRTTSGKIAIAQDLMAGGHIKSPQQYITLINTGKLDALEQGEMNENILIASENEALRDGRPVKAIITDQHDQHIIEHRAILANNDLRFSDPDMLIRTLDHIQDHLNLRDALQTSNPGLAQILGLQPLPQGVPSQGEIGTGSAAALNPETATVQKAAEVRMPSMPSLPKNAPMQSQEAYNQLQAG